MIMEIHLDNRDASFPARTASLAGSDRNRIGLGFSRAIQQGSQWNTASSFDCWKDPWNREGDDRDKDHWPAGIASGCVWAIAGWHPVWCASVQTAALVAMNSLEIVLARELLISAIGMVALNLIFLALVWWWATFAERI